MLAAERRLAACAAELRRARNAIHANKAKLDVYIKANLGKLPPARDLRAAIRDWRAYERRLIELRDGFESAIKRRENGRWR